MNNKVQLNKNEIIMGFVASCIEDVADTLGVDYYEVYRRMDAMKMIDEYIIPNYEVLHSESRRNVTEGLIHLNDGKKAYDFISWRNGGCDAS